MLEIMEAAYSFRKLLTGSGLRRNSGAEPFLYCLVWNGTHAGKG